MSPGVQLHNKLNWINRNTERERFHFSIPFSIINLGPVICSLLDQHGPYNRHDVSWFNALAWQNIHIHMCVYIYLFSILWIQLFFTFLVTWISLLRQAVQSFKANGGNEQQGRGNSLFHWPQETVNPAHPYCETSALKGIQLLQHPTAPQSWTCTLWYKQDYTYLLLSTL